MRKSTTAAVNSSQKFAFDRETLSKRLVGIIPKNLELPSVIYPELLLDLRYWQKLYDIDPSIKHFIRYTPCLWAFLRISDINSKIFVWHENLLQNQQNPSNIMRVNHENVGIVDTLGKYAHTINVFQRYVSLPFGLSISLSENRRIEISGPPTAIFCMILPTARTHQLHIPIDPSGKGQTILSKMRQLLYWPSDVDTTELSAEFASKYYTVLYYDEMSGEKICMLHNSVTLGSDVVPYNWTATELLALTNNLGHRFCDLRQYLHIKNKTMRTEVETISSAYCTRILDYPTGPVILFKCKATLEVTDDSIVPFTMNDYFYFRRFIESTREQSAVWKLLDHFKLRYKKSHTLSPNPSPVELAEFARYLFEIATCWIYDGSDNYSNICSELELCGENSPFKKGRYASYHPLQAVNPLNAIWSTISGTIAYTCKDYLFLPDLWSEQESWSEFCLLNQSSLQIHRDNYPTSVNEKSELEHRDETQNVVTSAVSQQDDNQTVPMLDNNLIIHLPEEAIDKVQTVQITHNLPNESEPPILKNLEMTCTASTITNTEEMIHPRTPMGDIQEYNGQLDDNRASMDLCHYDPPNTPESLNPIEVVPKTPTFMTCDQSPKSEDRTVIESASNNRCSKKDDPQTDVIITPLVKENPKVKTRSKHPSSYEFTVRAMLKDIQKLNSSEQTAQWVKENRIGLSKLYHCMTVIRPSKGLTLCSSELKVKDFIVSNASLAGIQLHSKREPITPAKIPGISAAIRKKN